MNRQPKQNRFGTILAALAGLALVLNGVQFLALLIAGTPARAHIRNAVSASGARNPVYRVHYEFESAGHSAQGLATLSASSKPFGSLPIRYLTLAPAINYFDSPGLLAAYGLLSLLPGALLLRWALPR